MRGDVRVERRVGQDSREWSGPHIGCPCQLLRRRRGPTRSEAAPPSAPPAPAKQQTVKHQNCKQ